MRDYIFYDRYRPRDGFSPASGLGVFAQTDKQKLALITFELEQQKQNDIITFELTADQLLELFYKLESSFGTDRKTNREIVHLFSPFYTKYALRKALGVAVSTQDLYLKESYTPKPLTVSEHIDFSPMFAFCRNYFASFYYTKESAVWRLEQVLRNIYT